MTASITTTAATTQITTTTSTTKQTKTSVKQTIKQVYSSNQANTQALKEKQLPAKNNPPTNNKQTHLNTNTKLDMFASKTRQPWRQCHQSVRHRRRSKPAPWRRGCKNYTRILHLYVSQHEEQNKPCTHATRRTYNQFDLRVKGATTHSNSRIRIETRWNDTRILKHLEVFKCKWCRRCNAWNLHRVHVLFAISPK